MDSAALYFQFSAAGVLFFCAFLLLARRTGTFADRSLAGLYFALSCILFCQWIFASGNASHFRYVRYQDTAAALLIGPCIFFYLKAVTGGAVPDLRLYALNFLPAILCFAATLHENISNSKLQTLCASLSPKLPDPGFSPFIHYADIFGSIHVFVYVIISIFAISPVLRNRKHRSARELRFVLVYMLFIAMFITGVVITDLMHSLEANLVFLNLLLFAGLVYFVFSVNYPEFAYNAMKEGRRIRADNNPVDEHDAADVMARLDSLMGEEKIFTDENLALYSAADRIGVSPHLLSRVLNSRLKTNFRTYINTWRIEEAKRLLAHEKEMAVLEIAYRTGFNSKSAFNDIFLKMTGMTPREFRGGKKTRPS